MISFSKSDVISLFIKTGSKLYEAKDQIFDLLYQTETECKHQKLKKVNLKPVEDSN